MKGMKGRVIFFLIFCMLLCYVPVFAEINDNVEIVFTDVTADNLSTLPGEAKILVSVKGLTGNVNIAQLGFSFEGNMKYKSIDFLTGENNPDKGSTLISPIESTASNDKSLLPSIISVFTPIHFDGEQKDLFILTFSGDIGGQVKLLFDESKSYFEIEGKDILASNPDITIDANASAKANESKKADISIVMDKITDFRASEYCGVNIRIINERTNTVINAVMSENYRDKTKSIPTFYISNDVLAEDTYTVEVFGTGYIPYKKTGVDFINPLEIRNEDFKPGDINGDGNIDSADKKLYNNIINEGEFIETADFNRDGKVDRYDNIFEGIKDEKDDDKQGSGSKGDGGQGGNSTGTDPTVDPISIPSNNETFTDLVNYSWAKDAIYSLKDKGIINGTSKTEYSPAANIKRGDFILILTRMLGTDNAFTENFADVPANSYYYEAIGKAKAAGIANGDGQNFRPKDSITRQDLITLSYRAFLEKGLINETQDISVLDHFNDKNDISDYALTAMASMVSSNIIKGSNGKVNPLGKATRAEVAVMCSRLVNLMLNSVGKI